MARWYSLLASASAFRASQRVMVELVRALAASG